jgi:Yip1 domain
MIKALFLIFEPAAAWDRVVEAQRGLKSILGLYLLPMLLIVVAVQGFGMVEWGKYQSAIGVMKKYTVNQAVVYCTAQFLLLALVVIICAHLVKVMGETFHGRHTYTQAFTLISYGLSPLFLLQLLEAFPTISPWLPWGVGVLLTIAILYQGLPRVMQPDPTHAFGYYIITMLLTITVTGFKCFITAWCISGRFPALDNFVSQLAPKLPF